ncbi:MAG: hypothetical protein U0174_02710 [Polyangiaceae bacterium]
MKDRIAFAALSLSFAIAIVFLVATVFGLAKKTPRIRALLGALVPPLAVYFGFKEGLRGRAMGLLVSMVAYAVLRLLAAF